eukprot:gene3945-7155_t
MFTLVLAGASAAMAMMNYLNSDEQPNEQKEEKKVEKKDKKKTKELSKEPLIFEKKEEYSFHDVCEVSEDCECQYGFKRPDFKNEVLTGNVSFHQKFIFVCSGMKSSEWPQKLEKETEIGKILDAAIRKHSKTMKLKLSFLEDEPMEKDTIDLLVFPDCIKYINVKKEHVEDIIENVIQSTTSSTVPSTYVSGTWVFVCCHHSRDKRCGTCGPRIFKEFVDLSEKYESKLPGDIAPLHIRRCSHVGGHKFASNTVIFKYDSARNVYNGEFFGFVDLKDVDRLYKDYMMKNSLKPVFDIWLGRTDCKNETAKLMVKVQNQK